MSTKSFAAQFVKLCNQGKNFDIMRTMYAPNIVSIEADGQETVGQMPVMQKSERWAADKTINGETARGPFFNGPNQFAVDFTLDITRKASGERVNLREIAVYTVQDEKITREQFFYDGER
jgi:hypothetical protein